MRGSDDVEDGEVARRYSLLDRPEISSAAHRAQENRDRYRTNPDLEKKEGACTFDGDYAKQWPDHIPTSSHGESAVDLVLW